VGKEIANTKEGRAGLGGSADFAFEDLIERNPPVQHLVEIQAIHADDPLAPPKGHKTVIGEAAVADEKSAGPRRLLLDLAMEGMQLGDADGLAVPFGFEQIDFAAKLKAAVDLFAPQPEGFLRGQAECVEQLFEKPSNAYPRACGDSELTSTRSVLILAILARSTFGGDLAGLAGDAWASPPSR
jgi:hypothetical protein